LKFDTVADALRNSNTPQPFSELGLKPDEYERIKSILGRRPTSAELAMYSVMWSEHCSYKSSKVHLRKFGEIKTSKNVLAGIGENAGVIDIGDGWAATFKVESHNHPSYIEPYQGAATGVGGIVRDIVAMGARPVAVMDSLRFGPPDSADVQRVISGVVAGIGGYGNCLGLPNIGGETKIHASYEKNPLVNALCVGVMRHEDVHFSKATGEGNLVVLYGASTGGDGIGGVSILASEVFDETKSAKRPSVQVGDPFTEKLLIEATMEMFASGLVEGIQDLGGAGLSCATSELASNGGAGMRVRLEEVPLRDSDLSVEEILMSESQERMCAIVRPENLEQVMKVCEKWGLKASVIGEITGEKNLVITWNYQEIVNVPPRTVAHEGPEYQRPFVMPISNSKGHTPCTGADFGLKSENLKEAILRVMSGTEVADFSAITDQYDRYVRGQTVLSANADAGLVRVSDDSTKGLAVSLDGNGRICAIDADLGTQWSVLEACRNVAAVGAIPQALTNCLNFGSPEDPEVMGQFVAATNGLATAATALDLPVTGGNVSFYNQTGETAIVPTPVIGALGVIDDVHQHASSEHLDVGDVVYVVGELLEDLSGSLLLETMGLSESTMSLPEISYENEARLITVLPALISEGLIRATHDISDGGLVTALVEMVRGHRSQALSVVPDDDVEPFVWAFAEFGGRVVCVVKGQSVARFEKVADERKLTYRRIGDVISSNYAEQALEIRGFCQFTHEELIIAFQKGMLLKH